jgi:uncharacterized membrane protein
MIQRIQSVYLFLASAVIYTFYLFPIANIMSADGAKKIMISGVFETINNQVVQTTPFTLLSIVTGIIGIIPLVLIFQYKNRKRQATLVYLNVLVLIGLSFWIAQTVKGVSNGLLKISDYGIGAGLSSVSILFLVLAAKGILRDEKLVKSADRLR